MAANADGNPIDFEVAGDEVHDSKAAKVIVKRMNGERNFIADKGYDSDKIRAEVQEKIWSLLFLENPIVKSQILVMIKDFNKRRHLAENLFAKLKHFRGIEVFRN